MDNPTPPLGAHQRTAARPDRPSGALDLWTRLRLVFAVEPNTQFEAHNAVALFCLGLSILTGFTQRATGALALLDDYLPTEAWVLLLMALPLVYIWAIAYEHRRVQSVLSLCATMLWVLIAVGSLSLRGFAPTIYLLIALRSGWAFLFGKRGLTPTPVNPDNPHALPPR